MSVVGVIVEVICCSVEEVVERRWRWRGPVTYSVHVGFGVFVNALGEFCVFETAGEAVSILVILDLSWNRRYDIR